MDRKIVEESYLAFSPSLYLYALSLTKDERKAEQLVSEAYYKLLCQTHAPDQLKFWLLRVVKTSFIDQYRKKQYRQSVDLATQQITFTESFESQILQKERNRQLYLAILSLPIPYQELILLFYFADCSTAELAQYFQLTVNQVRVYLHRARKKLKEVLQDEY